MLEVAPPGAVMPSNPTSVVKTLDARLREVVGRCPQAPAVRHGGTVTSYGELWRRSGRWLSALEARGVTPGALVGVCLRRTPDLVAALVAVHRAGAAYVPLDPDYPLERIDFILRDSDSSLVLAQRDTVTVTGGHPAVLLEELPQDLSQDLPQDLPGTTADRGPARPDDLAYVIYTSGSTGRPKGVAIEHRQAAALVDWAANTYTATELSGVLGSTSICFDLSVFEIFATLCAGGTLVLADNALALPLLPDRDRVTLVNTVPSAMGVLTRDGDLPASVRTVNLAGEPLTRALADAVYAVPTVERVYNLYGPSEDTTYSTWALVPRGGEEEPTIGTPLPRTRAHLLDEQGAAVVDGDVGELFLAGAGVARGYLGRPDLTAERFLVDPDDPTGRMYRTGDLCVRGADGQLRYRGRVDHQVKIRGFRVELGEIEATLVRHPGVESAVVVVREGADGGPALVAFVQPVGSGEDVGLPDELTAAVAARLPDYMVPRAVVPLPALPLTPNGKVDRAALPHVELGGGSVVGGREPEGERELLVARTWAEVLGRTGVPADVAFGDLGGQSLLAASVLSRLARDTGVRLGLPQFPLTATVADLATTLGSAPAGWEDPLLPGPNGDGRSYAPAPIQVEFWVVDHVSHQEVATCVMPFLLRVEGDLDPAVLQRALDVMPLRHEVLCTAIVERDGRLLATVTPARPVPLDRVAGLDTIRELARQPIDLEGGQLLRAAVAPAGDGATHLLIRVHHAACDGWSIGLVVSDLAEVYAALAAGHPAPPTPAVQFADGAEWLERARNRERDRMKAYWTDRMSGLDPDQAPPATRRPAGERRLSRRGSRVTRALDPGLVRRMRDLAHEWQVTEYSLLLAVSALRLYKETGQTDVSLRVPVANRRHPALESVVGPFLETAVTRVDLSGDPSFVELVQRVSRQVVADLENSWAESVHMLDASGVVRDSGGRPVGQMLVAVQNYPAAVHEVDGIRWVYVNELDNGGAKTDIGLFWELDVADGPLLNIEFDTVLHTAEAAERMAAQLERMVTGALDHGGDPVSRLDWAGTADLAAVAALNERRPLLPEATTPAAVAHQARLTPETVAISCPRDGEVTYAQLHDRALATAGAVRAVTGGPGREPVAVACRRGAEGMAAMLGAWYAGRPYLPLDSTHPVARLRDIVVDSGAVAMVADDSCPTQLADLVPRVETKGSTRAADLYGGEHGPSADPHPVQPGDTAYVIYTSGSTGRPKGVRIGHGALAAFLQAMDEVVPTGAADTLPAVTTPSFDIAGLEMWLPLRRGARVGVVTEEATRDGYALGARLAELGATVVQMTPSGWHLLLDAGWPQLGPVRALAGAEPVPPTLVAELLPRCAEVWNVYGPTEATIWSCIHRVRPEDAEAPTVPIGRPLANTRVHVLDHDGRPAPVGAVGLIHLAGSSLAEGYHQRPELTHAAFTHAPHLPDSPRIYRTGDLGFLREDGVLECLGRADNQVKVRGVRIELEEVDSAIRAVPGVLRATSRVQPDGPAAGQLVGYVVREHAGVTSQLLRDRVADRLPSAMVPTLWEVLDELPLNSSGKIDRRALPAPTPVTGADGEELSELEEFIAEVWAEHLPVDLVGAGSNFFDLGGHSLTATRVVAAVRQDLEVDIEVRVLFTQPTLRDFAGAVERVMEQEMAQ